MDFFDIEENVEEYIKMSEDYNNEDIINNFIKYVKKGSSVLELGMGPGKDHKKLKKYFNITSSDRSKVFVDRFNKSNPNDKALVLDAKTLNIVETFDALFSNKVLIHLTKDELISSIKRQKEILNKNGIIFHTFWIGEGEEKFNGLYFKYYNALELKELLNQFFKIIKIEIYKESEEADSLLIVAQKINE